MARWHFYLNASAAARIATDLQTAIQGLRSFAHVEQSEVATSVQKRFNDFEPTAIVIHSQRNLSGRILKPNKDRLCVRSAFTLRGRATNRFVSADLRVWGN
jgi:hypothetical protein